MLDSGAPAGGRTYYRAGIVRKELQDSQDMAQLRRTMT